LPRHEANDVARPRAECNPDADLVRPLRHPSRPSRCTVPPRR
jgi:hypothetical protein